MAFQSIIPILYSSDIARSIQYYTEVLGFKDSWIWKDSPTFGGVSMGDVSIYFSTGGQGQPGTWLAINLDDVDDYHRLISANGAKILNPPESYSWGMREMLVEDPDGHKIRFGHWTFLREKSKLIIPDQIEIVTDFPSSDQMKKLMIAVEWMKPEDEMPAVSGPATAHTVIAKDKNNNEIIGCAFLSTDNAGFYYMKNVIVHPDWQGKRIGTALVQHLDNWFLEHAPDKSTVTLHTGPHLAPFYRQFGFSTTFSMEKKIFPKK